MYQRWAENKQFEEILEETIGEEAGIKSITMRLNGDNAMVWQRQNLEYID